MKTKQLGVRLDVELLKRVEDYARSIEAGTPGLVCRQSDAVRILLSYALDAYKRHSPEVDILPAGNYPVVIREINIKQSSDGTGKIANVILGVTGGPAKGKIITDEIKVFYPAEPTEQEDGRKQLADLLSACDKIGSRNLNDLINVECIAKVQVGKDSSGAYNIISAYKAKR